MNILLDWIKSIKVIKTEVQLGRSCPCQEGHMIARLKIYAKVYEIGSLPPQEYIPTTNPQRLSPQPNHIFSNPLSTPISILAASKQTQLPPQTRQLNTPHKHVHVHGRPTCLTQALPHPAHHQPSPRSPPQSSPAPSQSESRTRTSRRSHSRSRAPRVLRRSLMRGMTGRERRRTRAASCLMGRGFRRCRRLLM